VENTSKRREVWSALGWKKGQKGREKTLSLSLSTSLSSFGTLVRRERERDSLYEWSKLLASCLLADQIELQENKEKEVGGQVSEKQQLCFIDHYAHSLKRVSLSLFLFLAPPNRPQFWIARQSFALLQSTFIHHCPSHGAANRSLFLSLS